MDELKKQYEEAKASKDILSGNLQFDGDYISQFDLFKAIKNWAKEDPSVLTASIRGGGMGRLVVDFTYELQVSGTKKMGPGTTTMHNEFKPFFEKELGGNYLHRWDIGNHAIVVK